MKQNKLNKSSVTYENATGPIEYTLTSDLFCIYAEHTIA